MSFINTDLCYHELPACVTRGLHRYWYVKDAIIQHNVSHRVLHVVSIVMLMMPQCNTMYLTVSVFRVVKTLSQ